MTADRHASRRASRGGLRAFFVAVLSLALLLPAAPRAQTAEDWEFSVTTYAFLPVSTSGTSTVAGQSADLDLDLGDILELLNLAGAVRAEAWYGRWGVIMDGYYTNIGVGTRLEGPAGVAAANVKVESRQGWASLLGGYRVVGPPVGAPGPGPALDLAAGVRFNMIDQEVRLRGVGDLLPGPGLQRRLGGTETFFEPQVSLRGSYPLSEAWTLAARVDLSGFGVAGDELQWLALAGAEWRAFDDVAFRLGWQVYGIDYATRRDDGRFAYDIVQTGPYLGLTWRF